MPYVPDPGDGAPALERLAFQASREVRHTVIRVICTHLRPDAAVSWQGRNLDFTGVVFDGAVFSGGTVGFQGVVFSGGEVDFSQAADWSHRPKFDWYSLPPGVKLPPAGGRESP